MGNWDAYDLESVTALLKSRLTAKRYNHSLDVAARARQLAAIYHANEAKASFIGLIHDICKDIPLEEQRSILRDNGVVLSPEEQGLPQLFHAQAGSLYLKNELNIEDIEILNAVQYHTTGRAGMSLMEEIIYLADLTSADRHYPDAAFVHTLADENKEEAMLYSLGFIITSQVQSRSPICKDTAEAYNAYSMMAQRRQ